MDPDPDPDPDPNPGGATDPAPGGKRRRFTLRQEGPYDPPVLRMSMEEQQPGQEEEAWRAEADAGTAAAGGNEFAQAEAAEVDSTAAMDTSELAKEEDNYDVMQDLEFLQSILENLPGVDPNNEAIQNAIEILAFQAAQEKQEKHNRKDEEQK